MRLSGHQASSSALRWRPRQRVVLLALLGLNLAAFIIQQTVQAYAPLAVPRYLGLSYQGIDQAFSWQFFSSMFLYPGVFAFAGCTLLLFLIGRDVQAIVGEKHFLYLYFLGAIGGELGHLFLLPNDTVLLAAAGGVAAIVVAFGTILPDWQLADSLLFLFPVKVKAKHLAAALLVGSVLALIFDRHGVVSATACFGGGVTGWLYAHLLGFGGPPLPERLFQQRRRKRAREAQMSAEEFIAEKIDPLLEKISRSGFSSLTRSERKLLDAARARMNAAEG